MNSLWRNPITDQVLELQRDINVRISQMNEAVYFAIDWARPEPMRLDTFFRLQAAAAARRLDTFEQQLQRRRILAEHEAGELARRLAKWEAVEAASPYRSNEVH